MQRFLDFDDKAGGVVVVDVVVAVVLLQSQEVDLDRRGHGAELVAAPPAAVTTATGV